MVIEIADKMKNIYALQADINMALSRSQALGFPLRVERGENDELRLAPEDEMTFEPSSVQELRFQIEAQLKLVEREMRESNTGWWRVESRIDESIVGFHAVNIRQAACISCVPLN